MVKSTCLLQIALEESTGVGSQRGRCPAKPGTTNEDRAGLRCWDREPHEEMSTEDGRPGTSPKCSHPASLWSKRIGGPFSNGVWQVPQLGRAPSQGDGGRSEPCLPPLSLPGTGTCGSLALHCSSWLWASCGLLLPPFPFLPPSPVPVSSLSSCQNMSRPLINSTSLKIHLKTRFSAKCLLSP